MDTYRCICTKRELRTFRDEAIPNNILLKILNAGRWSGSSRNRQPWHFTVIRDRQRLRLLATFGRYAGHVATAAAAVCVSVDGAQATFDAGRCAQNIMLAAWNVGIASCPATMHRADDARELLGLPGGQVIATVISLGYAAQRGRGPIERATLRILAGRGRRPLASMVSWERYGASPGAVAGL